MPTAVPMMAASASGLSITRWEPNFRWRSSVTRKTPPSTPTSSPRISTSGSRSISCRSARLSAFTMLSLVMGVMYRSSSPAPTVGGLRQVRWASFYRSSSPAPTVGGLRQVRWASFYRSSSPAPTVGGLRQVRWASSPRQALAAHRRRALRGLGRFGRGGAALAQPAGELLALRAEVGRHLGVDVVEDEERVGRRRRLEAPHRLRDLLVHPLLEPVLQEVLLLEVGAEARERVLLLPRRHLLLGPILSGIVRGRVDAKAVRHALDQRRTLTRARPLDRLARGRVDREHVVAVHLDPGQTVGERLLGDRLRVGLLLERYGDRPLVVLADEHDRHVPDPREVQRLVEGTLAGRALAERRHDDRVVAAVLGGVGQRSEERRVGKECRS